MDLHRPPLRSLTPHTALRVLGQSRIPVAHSAPQLPVRTPSPARPAQKASLTTRRPATLRTASIHDAESTHTQVSFGLYYCTSSESASAFAFAEGPHFIGFDNNSFGDLWRLSDERNSVDNSREIRVSPTGPANAVMIRSPTTLATG